MSWLGVTAALITLLLLGYLVIWPLSKRRPVILTEKLLAGQLAALALTVGLLASGPAGVVLLILAALYLWFHGWLIIGIKSEPVWEASLRSATATLLLGQRTGNEMNILNVSRTRIRSVGAVHFVTFKLDSQKRKKAKLAKQVFRKFLQNYYLKQ